jgi:hypothetical protein
MWVRALIAVIPPRFREWRTGVSLLFAMGQRVLSRFAPLAGGSSTKSAFLGLPRDGGRVQWIAWVAARQR